MATVAHINGDKRFDVWASARFPIVSPRRLALQIRQDMWRRLQTLRGFSPVIEITEMDDGLRAKAGGQIDGRFPKAFVEGQIADLLEDPKYRERWIKYASRTRTDVPGLTRDLHRPDEAPGQARGKEDVDA